MEARSTAITVPRVLLAIPRLDELRDTQRAAVRRVSTIEAVLFDLDRTLVTFDYSGLRRLTADALRAVHDHLLQSDPATPSYRCYFAHMTFAFLLAVVQSKLTGREIQTVDTMRQAHARMGIHLCRDRTIEAGRRCSEVVLPRVTVDAESRDTIARLRETGLELGVVSNTLMPGFAVDDFLRSVGLLHGFSTRVYSSDVRFMKPHPRIFQTALARLAVAPNRAVFVGDNPRRDIAGASRLGMRTILFDPRGRARLGRVKPDHVVRRLSEIPPLLANLGTA